MQNRKALGRGLDVLMPSSEVNNDGIITTALNIGTEKVRQVAIDNIIANRLQPRKTFNEGSLKELAESIKEEGIIQPLIVTEAAGGRYELVAGERRWRAAKIAGLNEVPVIVKNLTPEEMLEFSIVENIQREDLNVIEESLAYKELMTQFDYTQEEIAEKLGKSRVAVANSLRLLNLPKALQDDVSQGRLSSGHARALLSLKDAREQLMMRDKILSSQLTVRDIERMIQNLNPRVKVTVRRGTSLTPQMKQIADEMTVALSTKVTLQPDKQKKGGKITIEYYSAQDLDRIYTRIVK